MLKRAFFLVVFIFIRLYPSHILIYMDNRQTNHLKAYGITYFVLKNGYKARWLLNYRGGSFLLPDMPFIRERCIVRNVAFSIIDDSALSAIYEKIANSNMESVLLEKAPHIAVYTPPSKEPWDDAVTLVLEYAEIDYDKIYDREIQNGMLYKYDWLHLHHEDFTGQYGKFYAVYRNSDWYLKMVSKFRSLARKAGYRRVADYKLATAKKIRQYVADGGFLFAMCAATDTLDIALAADGVDIVPKEIDGTPITPNAQSKLRFKNTFAFTHFKLIFNPYIYEFSNIDIDVRKEGLLYKPDYFVLFRFAAKIDTIATILNQNHKRVIKGFLGQTTEFNRDTIKDNVTILADIPGTKRVKYIYGDYGKGFFCFYAGHDPEDYRHLVGDPPTDLDKYPNSPGYRLILNNILFPAAKKKKRKT